MKKQKLKMPAAVLPVALNVKDCAHREASCFHDVWCVSRSSARSGDRLSGSAGSSAQLSTLWCPFDEGLLERTLKTSPCLTYR